MGIFMMKSIPHSQFPREPSIEPFSDGAERSNLPWMSDFLSTLYCTWDFVGAALTKLLQVGGLRRHDVAEARGYRWVVRVAGGCVETCGMMLSRHQDGSVGHPALYMVDVLRDLRFELRRCNLKDFACL